MNSVGWRLRDAAAEVFRNAASTPGRMVLAGVVSVAVFASISGAELIFSQELLAYQTRLEREGGYVAIATAAVPFPSWRCSNLEGSPYVIGAAGLARSERITSASAPGLSFQSTRFSGSTSVWDPDKSATESSASQFVLGGVAAEELGIRTGGQIIPIGSSFLQVESILHTDLRNPEIARWMLTRGPPDMPLQECWVEFAPGQLEPGIGVLAASLTPDSRGVEVRSWRRFDEFARDPLREMVDRLQRLAWLPAGLLLGLLTWLVSWFRRSDLGLYRALGTSDPTIWLMAQVESVIINLGGLAAGFLIACVLHSARFGFPNEAQLLIAGRNAASAALLAIVLGPFGSLFTGRVSIAQQIKDQ